MTSSGESLNKAGYLLIIGSLQFILLWKIAEFLRPGYSVAEDVISALGIGENSFIFNGSVALLGLLGIAAAYFLKDLDKIFAALLGISSVGALGVGLFPMDIPLPHSIAALLTFLFSGLAALYSYRLEKTNLKYLWALLGIITLIALYLFMTKNYMGLGRGGMERLIVYPALAWLLMYGRGIVSK